jgi:hypothetical protein
MSGTACSICGNVCEGELAEFDDGYGGHGTVCADRRACNVREASRWFRESFGASVRGMEAGFARLGEACRASSVSLSALAARRAGTEPQ